MFYCQFINVTSGGSVVSLPSNSNTGQSKVCYWKLMAHYHWLAASRLANGNVRVISNTRPCSDQYQYITELFQVWDLDKKSSVLNALPTTQTYGIISSLLAPLSVGGRVVMMDKFDSVKVCTILDIPYSHIYLFLFSTFSLNNMYI